MMKRALPLLIVVAEYSAFSAIQFILSFTIGAHLSTHALAGFTIATLIATFGASMLRSAFLTPLLFAGSHGKSRPTPDDWRAMLCVAAALCGLLALLASIALYALNHVPEAAAVAASAPLLMTMSVYDVARRRSDRTRGISLRPFLAFSATVAVSASILIALPGSRSTLVASLLAALCYAVAALPFLRAAAKTVLTTDAWRSAWGQASSTISTSPVIALATGAIMQGLPLLATAGAPSTLALYYLSRILAMPAVNILQALDAVQKSALRSAVGEGRLLASALRTAGMMLAVMLAYALVAVMLLPTLKTVIGPSYTHISAADLLAWTALLLAQIASGTADNAAYAVDRARAIAYGRPTGALVALALWAALQPTVLAEILLVMALGFVVSAAISAWLLPWRSREIGART